MAAYKISEEEASTELPYSKILQLKWKSGIGAVATGELKRIHKRYLKGSKRDLSKLQIEVDGYVARVRAAHPEEFPAIGWWDKKQAKVAMKESTIKGRGSFEVCKVCGIKLPDRSNAGVEEIEGELWVVHRRCVKKVRELFEHYGHGG